MVFSSSYFMVYFLPIFLLVYFSVGKKLKNPVLLLASIFFFSWGAPRFIFLLLATTAIDFYLVRWMSQQSDARKKKRILIVSLALNIGLLAVFKYANFFVEGFNELLYQLGVQTIGWTEIALPIGISFFVFESITYALDVYRGDQKPLDNFFNYLLYILLFPKLIVGPIIPYRTIAHQITDRSAFETTDNRLNGFYQFCIGLAKKVLIANQIGLYTKIIFEMDFLQLDAFTAWFGLFAFAFQLYFDFSGYSDMAIGLAKMLGFTIPENFNSPYISTSITEFWTRWHISLGKWMKDYLYIPLGGNRVSSKKRLYFNLGLVFLLSGLWHGASWNFVFWGIYHGIFMILERLFLLKFYERVGRILRIAITFMIVVTGYVFFHTKGLDAAFTYFGQLLPNDVVTPVIFDTKFYVFFIVAAVLSFAGILKIGRYLETALYTDKQTDSGHLIATFASFVLLVLSASFLVAGDFNPFIYFQF
ncbi:MAG: sugar acetyltransferase [Candidatus Fluviicola riflensis]|nr:MAG: sugar acetyltransferase [Candidatus Fluviicola riflensis]OGS76822.1 MAG: sugar acetyltransferase [Candidatus Fluviicola riflensis]OGS81752.1 MAG: sugar acetyltransferase [Fluviicola sp. RIFCSPHIGHO2_01_FULL_43_53]OGS88551.1 MAG: sugar acetyltransferase [Fluviicola sp. RIFCSPHIGHO2_12_FULL_43_24]